MNALAKMLRDSLASHAERPALGLGGLDLTYAELGEMGDTVAGWLAANTPAASRVGILAQRSVEAYASILGCVLAGRAYVPINPKMPLERHRAIAEVAGCAAYLYDGASEERARALAGEFGGAAWRCEGSDAALKGQCDYNAEEHGRHAYVMFTSGTTGTPKGVAVRYDNVAAYITAFRAISAISPEDRCTQLFDLSFDLSVHDMFCTWTSGAKLCAPTDAELIDPVGYAVRYGATCWFSVPSVGAFARRTRRLKPDALPGLRLALFCGEPLPTSLARDFQAAAPRSEVWNLYGPTEATIAITAYRFNAAEAAEMPSSVPLGEAYDGCGVALVGNGPKVVGEGETGELWLAGAQLTDGYINNPGEQAVKFVSAEFPGIEFREWYRSGDLVKADPRWGLVYQSRLDDQVKISGYRVEILDIEEALRAAAGTSEVAAVAWPINEGGSADGVVGFVAEQAIDEKAIIARVRELLPAYMVPKRLLTVDKLLLNANGKVDRRALTRAYLETSAN